MACRKQDYVAIAAILKRHLEQKGARPSGELGERYFLGLRHAAESLANDLAHYFGSQSQAFDKVRFLTACSIGTKRIVRITAEVGSTIAYFTVSEEGKPDETGVTIRGLQKRYGLTDCDLSMVRDLKFGKSVEMTVRK